MENKVLTVCASCLLFTGLQAQNDRTITGRVLEETSGEALPGVNVVLYSADSTLITGASTDA
ncbi:MAG: carboxypeptidase-like regulatory domain-containing protein, partial [Tannerella sp.]|nr:carboxypeptidase-like regulatory domain-containing protein [Tannerella sp.]